MNQEKTGAFIAKRRKELNLTQKEMADKTRYHGSCRIKVGEWTMYA